MSTVALTRMLSAVRRSTTGSSPSSSSCRRSWRSSTPRSPTWRCGTSPAGCPPPERRRLGHHRYLAANAIVLPITGWLSAHLGRRNYFLLSIALFTLASAACGMATSLEQMILFRVIQGLAGGGLQPCSQGDPAGQLPAREAGHGHDPVRRRGRARPDRRADARRWLCVDYDWRWIFLHQRPDRPLGTPRRLPHGRRPRLPQEGAGELRGKPLNFDYIGLGLLSLVMACWEVTLSKGQEWDWFGDPSGRVQMLVDPVRAGARPA